ncbi:hypothetical protein RIF29_24702 [Crotalaria pallida]|uniref:Uncharacterized protein n=1 Tax=Crotalaria pallida TaxID=3830 RepID=A0AAN9I0F1_CROPI
MTIMKTTTVLPQFFWDLMSLSRTSFAPSSYLKYKDYLLTPHGFFWTGLLLHHRIRHHRFQHHQDPLLPITIGTHHHHHLRPRHLHIGLDPPASRGQQPKPTAPPVPPSLLTHLQPMVRETLNGLAVPFVFRHHLDLVQRLAVESDQHLARVRHHVQSHDPCCLLHFRHQRPRHRTQELSSSPFDPTKTDATIPVVCFLLYVRSTVAPFDPPPSPGHQPKLTAPPALSSHSDPESSSSAAGRFPTRPCHRRRLFSSPTCQLQIRVRLTLSPTHLLIA